MKCFPGRAEVEEGRGSSGHRLAGLLVFLSPREKERAQENRQTHLALPGASPQHRHVGSSPALPWQSHLALGGSEVRPGTCPGRAGLAQ